MNARKLTLADTGATGTIKARMPVHDRKAGWIVKERPVAVHGSTDDARTFAAAILGSWEAHRAAWVARVAPATVQRPSRAMTATCSRCGRADFRKRGVGLAWHVERCAA